MKHLSGPPLKGRLLSSPTNNRLWWKDLPGANTPAYCEHSYITDVKRFVAIGQGLFKIKG